MKPMTLNLIYLIESEQKTVLIGKDEASGHLAAIQVDVRPNAAFWASLDKGTNATTYGALGVRLSLEFEVTEGGAVTEPGFPV